MCDRPNRYDDKNRHSPENPTREFQSDNSRMLVILHFFQLLILSREEYDSFFWLVLRNPPKCSPYIL